MQQIPLDRNMILAIRTAYNIAKANNIATFTVRGYAFVTTYAGYFLEHYAPQFSVHFKR